MTLIHYEYSLSILTKCGLTQAAYEAAVTALLTQQYPGATIEIAIGNDTYGTSDEMRISDADIITVADNAMGELCSIP
jgi:hypothetical protein